MLILTRRIGETLNIGDNVQVTVLGIKGHQVRIGNPSLSATAAVCIGAPVAQLDRVPGYEPGGREFESLRARQFLCGTVRCYLRR